MNFILTRYIYPISDSINISTELNFELDNPRTEEEIELVLAHLEKSLNSPDEVYEYEPYFRLPISKTEETEDFLTIEDSLLDFEKNYSKEDPYVQSFFSKNSDSGVLNKLAQMWIIARFDDEGEYERLEDSYKEMENSGRTGLIMLHDNNPIVENSKNLVNYCYLLSLLFNTDEEFYNGQSLLLHHDEYETKIPKVDRFLNQAILYFCFMAHSIKINHEEDRWKSFFHIRNEIIEVSNNLNETINDSNKEKILYISNLLKVAGHDIKDEKYRIVTLVSIIELLLTHSPDYRRFNVEDSISKQFRLKASTLVYQNDKSQNLEWVKGRLKEIYNQRSNIAHGNFKKLDKYLSKKVKHSDNEDITKPEILNELTHDIYVFIRRIIEEYIRDRKFVEFLKEN